MRHEWHWTNRRAVAGLARRRSYHARKRRRRARIPYTLSVVGGATIEQAAEAAPDVFWLQLYRFFHDDHKIGFDLVRRAKAVGAKVLTLTLDVPVRTTRSRETYANLANEFRPDARMIWEMMIRPRWLMALLRNGYPRFATISDYAPPGANTNEVIAYARARAWVAHFQVGRGEALSRRLEGAVGIERHSAPCRTPRRRSRSVLKASGCQTTAAGRLRR